MTIELRKELLAIADSLPHLPWGIGSRYCDALEFAEKAYELGIKAGLEKAAEIADNFPTLYGFHSCFAVAGEIKKALAEDSKA